MSLMPEFILQSVIVRGVQALRKDSKLIDQLFRNVQKQYVEQIRGFIRSQQIDLCLNFPRDNVKVPAIIIILKNQAESQGFLGDSMGMETPDEFSYDEDEELLGGSASTSALSGQGRLVFGPYRASTGTNNTLVVDDRLWAIDQFVGKNYTLNLIGGKGSGQSRTIVANGQNSIMVSSNWTKVPDETTSFEVKAADNDTIGEPSPLYNRSNSIVEKKGYLESNTYQIHVIGGTPEQAIFLTTIVKSLFLYSRLLLEKQGLSNLKITAADFAPKPDYIPNYAYTRSLSLDFTTPFEIFEEQSNPDSLQLILESSLADGSVSEISTTTITI